MSVAITQRDLDQAWTDHGKRWNGHKHDYFGLLYLTRKFGGSVDEHAHKVAFGNNDYGFDAFLADVDVIAMGRATYDFIKDFPELPYGGRP